MNKVTSAPTNYNKNYFDKLHTFDTFYLLDSEFLYQLAEQKLVPLQVCWDQSFLNDP